MPEAPDEVLLVLDGSTGQNAYEQAKQFIKATEVTALAVTKLPSLHQRTCLPLLWKASTGFMHNLLFMLFYFT